MNRIKRYLTLALLGIAGSPAGAQTSNTGIGTIIPDGSAQLDVSATTRGFLLPRMTAAQRVAITNPATGLQVYQTDATAGLCYFDGINWISLPTGQLLPANGILATGSSATNTVSTLAGTGAVGSTDGAGTIAKFYSPQGLATDAAGNIYVADALNYKVRKVTPAGVVSTYAGTSSFGTADGPVATATFVRPADVAVDASGNVYVADENNNKIRKISTAGIVSTLAGTGATGSTDGPGTSATFSGPAGLGIDAAGNLYVTDLNSHLIRKVTPAGVVSTLAGTGTAGSTDGPAASATFNNPYDAAVDAAGNVYVADYTNNKIRKITPAGIVSTLAGTGTAGYTNGPGASATFNAPHSIALDAAGNIYVADNLNNSIRKISPAGIVSTLAGTGIFGTANGPGASATFQRPSGVATDGAGNVYVTEEIGRKVRKIIAYNLGVVTNVGPLPAVDGNALTNINAANLTGVYAALNGSAITNLNASNLASGTVPDARFPAILPAASGVNLTALNATNLASGTIPDARFPGILPAADGNALTNLNATNLAGTLPALNATALTALNASNLASGTLPDASFPATLPAVSGVNITALNAANLTSGAVPATRLTSVPAASLTGVYPALNGSAITNLSAASITPGGTLPALNGSALTNLTEADPKVGTLVNGYIPRWNSGASKLDTTAIYSSTGKIGIGTNLPATSLHVSGPGDQEVSIQSTTSGGRRWTLESNASTASLHNSFQIVDRTGGASRLGIDSAGQVGIGVPAPKQALDVEGGILARNFSPISNQGAYLQWNRSGSEGETFIINQRGSGGAQAGIRFGKSDVTNNITEFARFMDNGSFGINTPIPSSTLSVNGSADKIGGGSWGTFSDARVKKNVLAYSAGLKEILAIRPVSFQYNRLSGYSDTAKRFVGVIAQEIEKVLPSTVTILHNDPAVKDKRQYDGSELVYTLINAVKEQQAQLEELKKQNSAQQSVIDADHASLLSLQEELQLTRTGKTAKR